MVGSSSTRSESEKEKTKLRERQRRAITTKIFSGLRTHGGYHLSPRADINEVLRELAKEAGWIVEPDGTTFRHKLVNRCPTCGSLPNNASTATTPTTSSTVIAGGGALVGAGGGGECSTTTSPGGCIDPTMMTNTTPSNNHNYSGDPSTATASSTYICGGADMEIPLAFYMYRGLNHPSTTTAAMTAIQSYQQQQQKGTYMQEARASSHNTPVGSPLHPTN